MLQRAMLRALRRLFSFLLAGLFLLNATGACSQAEAGRAKQLLVSANQKLQNREPDGAITDLNAVIKIAPELPLGHIARALAWRMKGDLDRALADYSRAIEIDPTSPAPYDFRAAVFSAKGEHDAAIADCSQAIELEPDSAAAYVTRASAYLQKRELDRAITDCTRAIDLDSRSWPAYLTRGDAYAQKGEFEVSFADYAKGIALGPPNSIPHHSRGWARLRLGDYSGSISDFTKATEGEWKEGVHRSRGIAFAAQGNWAEADADFVAALQAEPGDMYTARYRYVAQVRLGNPEIARALLNDALSKRTREKPGDWHDKLGEFLLGNSTEEALLQAADTGRQEEIRTQRCEAWYFVGITRLAEGHAEIAAGCFRKCLASDALGWAEDILARAELARPAVG